jgi:acetylornithine deacetylase/succinyl-diaminopimelate desuccinylase-like protein
VKAVPVIDRERVAELSLGMTAIPSATGTERPVVDWIGERLEAHGAEVRVVAFEPNRANLVATRFGTGGGPSLLLYSPIDTAFGSIAGDPDHPAFSSAAQRDGDWIVGRGAENPKGFAAAAVAAFEALCAGPPTRGDLILTLTAGGMPAPNGFGRGCREYLATEPRPDAALVLKPGDAVSAVEAGIAVFRIRVSGDLAYTGSRHRTSPRPAIRDAAVLAERLEAWFPAYADATQTGSVRPQGAVTAIHGGWPSEPVFLPQECELTVDLRIAPGTSLEDATARLSDAVVGLTDDIESDVDIELLGGFPGAETSPDAWIVRAAVKAWEERTGRPHVAATGTSGVTDASILRAASIPTARIGMPAPQADPPYRGFSMSVVSIESMTMLATTVAAIATDVLARDRSALHEMPTPTEVPT